MSKVRCNPCHGSGKLMGGGMISSDCHHCDGDGFLMGEKPKKLVVDKDSKYYKKAIKKIMQTKDGMSITEAEKIFTEEFDKL